VREEQVGGGDLGAESDTTPAAGTDANLTEGDDAALPAAADAPDSGQREGRRRSRGGRNRRDRGDREEPRTDGEAGSSGVTATESVTSDADEVPLNMSAEAVPTERWTATPVAASYDEPSAPVPAPLAEVTAAISPTAVEATPEAPAPTPPVAAPEPAPAQLAAAPAAPASSAPLAASFVLETDALQAVAEGAGLHWVNSDAEKIRAAQEAMANEAKPVHVARVPKPVAAVDEGPLVLVETRRDLSQVKLPFEVQDGAPPAA
jgi:ribonuclease E